LSGNSRPIASGRGVDALGKRDAVSALIEKSEAHLAEAEYDQAIETTAYHERDVDRRGYSKNWRKEEAGNPKA